ncbi:WecB/TagA/CpsF family glycosyltransferase [Rhodococcus rhodochrous]|uniref:WecB/TagA/CpsF family glycosyltransferase n=1 Tax=Rhodococcus rhodochrous TaxID=1829 RepID=UPI0013223932|nr:WecB/TagA/CpsF family glycosyltransferase [Rhodococcus pyridinivorans]MXQ75089.1 WecB/TagA/CpsF family glycosyltransferase [Rhodococcus rhodochrous]
MHISDTPRSFPRVQVGKVPFDVAEPNEAIRAIVQSADEHTPLPVRLSNAFCVALASQDADYEKLLQGPGLNFADGAPVVAAMRFHSDLTKKPSRVRGPSLFRLSLESTEDTGLRHFFLGTTEETLSKLVAKIEEDYPKLKIAGTYSPPFGPLDENFYSECMARIESTSPDIVWVALGTPKQDFAAARLSELSSCPCVGVGAAFDFVAGTVTEAPEWIQNSYLEWLYRLFSEPKRLWRRYLFGNVQFIRSVFKEGRNRG